MCVVCGRPMYAIHVVWTADRHVQSSAFLICGYPAGYSIGLRNCTFDAHILHAAPAFHKPHVCWWGTKEGAEALCAKLKEPPRSKRQRVVGSVFLNTVALTDCSVHCVPG